MRIAVTTFFQSQTNYGQLLQAFALQQVLMRMGHFPYIIRYGFHKPFPRVLSTEPPQCCMDKLLSDKQVEVRKAGSKEDRFFDEFRQKHLNLSENAYNHLKELQLMPPIAECYITGSDQVWAQLLSCEDNQTFFLNFGPKEVLRIAYAPSFALQNYPEDLNDRLSLNLKRFQAVSVREKTGVDICRKAGTEAKWVVDPTMLLSSEDYRMLGKESQTEMPTNYMLVYHVNVTRKDFSCWDAFRNYNEENGIHAVAVHANGENQPDIEFIEGAEYLYPTIQDWIRLIDGSQYVLTTSYHGIIFSILLHKPFVAVLRPESMFAGNDRIVSILSELGLEDRIFVPGTDIQKQIHQQISWDSVDEKLDSLRQDSQMFLNMSLSPQKSSPEMLTQHEWTSFIKDRLFQYVISKMDEAKDDKHKITSLQQQIESLHTQLASLQKENQKILAHNNNLAKKGKKHLRVIRLLAVLLSMAIIIPIVLSL